MSYYRDVWIMCDGCKTDHHAGGRTAKEAREYAKNDGWVNKGSKDYCPRCKT